MCFYSLWRRAYSGTIMILPPIVTDKFLFAVAKGLQRHPRPRRSIGTSSVSIRCREGPTAEPGPRSSRWTCSRVSIRCREGRTAELPKKPTGAPNRFYSLSRRAYSGTAVPRILRGPRGTGSVSIRCREGRTAERTSCLENSGHHEWFLFAVAKGVQRNLPADVYNPPTTVSIRCREGRTAEQVP